jgi:hypothetical protein
VNFRTILGWVVLIFIIWWVITEPVAAAHVVHNIGAFLTKAASGIATFFASL